MAHRHSLAAPFVALSLALLFASSLLAQHTGHGSGAGSTQGTMHGVQNQMMTGEQSMRNVDSMMKNIESMMRDLSAMPMQNGQHEQMLTGMHGMFDQMRGVQAHLDTMMKDPQVMQHGDAMKGFDQACRDLEKMAAAFQSMTKNMNQAVKNLRHDQK